VAEMSTYLLCTQVHRCTTVASSEFRPPFWQQTIQTTFSVFLLSDVLFLSRACQHNFAGDLESLKNKISCRKGTNSYKCQQS